MADKKNIVIKVKYPTPGKMSEDDILPPKTITEWNVKRIVIALVSVMLVFTSLIYLTSKDSQNTALDKPEVVTPIINETSTKKPPIEVKSHVIRALLTYKVIDNEPASEIVLPLKISKKESTWIYFFVELTGMKDKTVYHEWLLDGELISRKKVNITGEKWRTASRQSFHYTSENNWTVRLVEESGEVVTEKHFNVIYE
jgi:hypothetical protein